uniref:Uncharacterized protein n=1 Tax=viral metagenome TaxID=1070528 RepID=A0A6M3M7G4_9ZZZZ
MEEKDLPFPFKTYKELKKMSKEELNICEVELMANVEFVFDFVYNIDNYKVKFGARIGKCEECEQDVWISKASDSYMSRHSGEILKIICKPCWKVMDKEEDEDRDVIATEETLKEFDDWYLSHYGYKPTREQTLEMMEHYIGKRPKITK